MKVYVASSWRNPLQPDFVEILRHEGHEVYDFKEPEDNGGTGFHWSEIDPDWECWTPTEFIKGLQHPMALEGYKRDFDAMQWCDAMVLVLPSGRSSHLELGWACGVGKHTAIYLSSGEPELMYRMAKNLFKKDIEIVNWLASL